MDRAFKSRIHVSLLYERFSLHRTLKVWENNIKRIEKEFNRDGKRGIDVKHKEILEFAKDHFKGLDGSNDLTVWNGRQVGLIILATSIT